MPTAFFRVLVAQFVSALFDNALLIVTIALLQYQAMPAWWAPLLKVDFIASYVVLAPFVGPLADAFPKAALMAWLNVVKAAGVAALCVGANPVAAFVVVGLGAAAYAPAKYGLATELVGRDRLVEANGWVEINAVCAVLLGTGLGGWLVGAAASHAFGTVMADFAGRPDVSAVARLLPALVLMIAAYLVAGLLGVGVGDGGLRHPVGALHPVAMTRAFLAANRRLWRDRDGALSLAVTTLFWGVGETLQFAVLRWGTERLHLPLARAALVQLAVAVGMISGAGVAGRWITLAQARRLLTVVGIAFGVLTTAVAFTATLGPAVALLSAVGFAGGLLLVPLNALLQVRGVALLSPGRSIAVQGANENAGVLVLLAVYTGLVALDVPLAALVGGLGLAVVAAVSALVVRDRRRDGARQLAAHPEPCGVDVKA